jgi:hypothetical protein
VTGLGLRASGVVPLAFAGAVALGAVGVAPAPAPHCAKTVRSDAKLLDRDTELWGMGGSGTPIPSQGLIDDIASRYLQPSPEFFDDQPKFPFDSAHKLFTPEGLYPVITGVKSLELDPSVQQGVEILDRTIWDRIDDHDLVIAGGSQSASIESIEMRNLMALPENERPDDDALSFVLLGNVNSPNGGLLSRFGDPTMPPLTIPSLGITFSGPTPADIPWDTAVYDREYDGFADFPTYPLNLLSDLNDGVGILAVHPRYPDLTDEQLAETIERPVANADGAQYFMVPTDDLPLMSYLVWEIPVVGNPIADLLEPDLKVLVNLGYGDIEHGWDSGPADVPTPFGLFPDVDWGEVFSALADGTKQGVHDFIDDLGSLSLPDLSSMPNMLEAGSLDDFTDTVNEFTSAISTAYAQLLPMADIALAMGVTLPTYDVNLFAQELESGNLLDAVGLPIAANLGVGTVAVGFFLGTVGQAIAPLADLF